MPRALKRVAVREWGRYRHAIMPTESLDASYVVVVMVSHPNSAQASAGTAKLRVHDLAQTAQLPFVGGPGIDQCHVYRTEQQCVRMCRRGQGAGFQGNHPDRRSKLDHAGRIRLVSFRLPEPGATPPGHAPREPAVSLRWAGPAGHPRLPSVAALRWAAIHSPSDNSPGMTSGCWISSRCHSSKKNEASKRIGESCGVTQRPAKPQAGDVQHQSAALEPVGEVQFFGK